VKVVRSASKGSKGEGGFVDVWKRGCFAWEYDRAVLAAYAATDPQGAWEEDRAEVWFDTGAGQALPEDHPLAARRGEVDQMVLANLLRLNHARAKATDAGAVEKLVATKTARAGKLT
jgi:hypothetical protein